MRIKHLVAILVLLALALPASPAHAGGVVSVCDEAHLRAALSGGGTVTFSCSGTIILTAEITIAANTTIDGSGQTVTISGNNAVRVYTVKVGVTLNLNRLIVANGAVYESGGGIYNDGGTVTVSNSTFAGNSANCQDCAGGGIYNDGGTVTVSNSTFSGNSATNIGGRGGGIYNSGTLTVSNSTFSGNSANDGGGGIDNVGMMTVTNSTFSANIAEYGGGIYNHDGTLTVSSSTFSNNSTRTGGSGGGIYDADGTVTVSNSTFSNNSASSYGGGIASQHFGTVTVSNSTFSGNSASYEGGGISVVLGALVIVSNSTFSGNSAGTGGGIHQDFNGTVTLKNTIVANSPTGGNCDGTITDGGGNLSYPDSTCPGINADPEIGPLQNNGGPTETMALGSGSAALDAGIDAICATAPVNSLDQRGVVRPQGSHCDIGAVEQIQEPAAVSVSALSAQGQPGAITPAMIAGLLLVALMAVGIRRHLRHMI